MNFLDETIEDIKDSGHRIGDIIFIGSEESGHRCTWRQFRKLADKEYDSGFVIREAAHDLIIVFKDGVKMWRNVDETPYWVYSMPFKEPKDNKKIIGLFVSGINWMNLADIEGG